MSTMTMLGTLAVESAEFVDQGGQGGPKLVMYRPADTPLRNDGIWRHWMARGETYQLGWDGTGWRVTCHTWASGHTYRLVEGQDMQHVSTLPLTDGALTLDPGRVYEIRETEPGRPWAVYAA